MSDFTDFLAELKDFVNRPDLKDSIVTRWVRMAETRMNQELRCREMLFRGTATLANNVVPLPTDCLDITYLRYANGKPLKVVTLDEFWEISVDPSHAWYRKPVFARHGSTLLINPNVNATSGTGFEIGYYKRVVPFADAATDLYLAYDRLYFNASLAASAVYLVEDDRIPVWESQATAMLQNVTDAHNKERFSGSPLHIRLKSFG